MLLKGSLRKVIPAHVLAKSRGTNPTSAFQLPQSSKTLETDTSPNLVAFHWLDHWPIISYISRKLGSPDFNFALSL
jgi:hypothetical protein